MKQDRPKVRISSFRLKDMLDFKNLPRRRDKAIAAASDADIDAQYPINENAMRLHPAVQEMLVHGMIEHPEVNARTILLKRVDGGPAAWFRAGQYVSLRMRIGESHVTRPYSFCSSPGLTREGIFAIAVQEKDEDAFVSRYLMHDIKLGDRIMASGPEGQFHHDRIRDHGSVIAVAGGSGVTPFLSMAHAIRDGIEDFDLTILMGSRTEETIFLREELLSVAEGDGRVKVVHVLSDEEKPGFEHGFITASLISRYAPKDYTLMVCGPAGLYEFMAVEIPKLGLPKRDVRSETPGVPKDFVDNEDYPQDAKGRVFDVTVKQGPDTYLIRARNDESILVALERAGIDAPSRCRGGECGWCRSKLLSGEVYIPRRNEMRRHMDRETGHIHVCVSFPVSDLVVEVPRGDGP